jgi:uncharacterized protein (TIRG00374 family)
MSEAEEQKIESGGLKPIFWFIVRLAVAVGIIGWLISSNFEKFLKAIENFNLLWLIPAALLYLLHLIVGGWRWKMLLSVQNIHISLFESFVLTIKSFFCSLVIPGGALGGDIAKVGFISGRAPKGFRTAGAFSILMDRFCGMTALFSLAVIVAVLSYPTLMKIGGFMETVIMVILMGCVGGLVAALGVVFHREMEKIPLVAWGIKFADKYSHGTITRIIEALDLYRAKYKTVLFCILISVIFIHLNIVVVVYCLSMGLGIEGISPLTYICATVIGNTAGVVPGSFGGIGLREWCIQSIMQAGGVSVGDSIAVPILYMFVVLAFNLSGGLFLIHDPTAKKKTEDIPVSDQAVLD